ncbi:MAG: HD-GYP domain-containing protein [Ruminococcus sp.]|nr:HD-GYP domain-containing protein [Ruminococcus sp.]
MEKYKKSIGEAFRRLSLRDRKPRISIIIPLLIYGVLYYCTTAAARSDGSLSFRGGTLEISTFAGVFSALASICLIVTVLYYKKPGFLITLAIIVIFQLPGTAYWVILKNNPMYLPGLFTALITIVMITIINRSQSKMENDKQQVQKLFEQTATALVNAIDAKDTYTHGHSSRVAKYAAKLAEMNCKSPEECDMVYYAALLHDVGKIGVPGSIINKPDKLTGEEYDIIKQHPVKGAQILETISEYPFLSLGAHYHHERYDGSGYPDGLRGDDIPEIARIIAVTDAYDAMTSIRSYRDPIPQEKVREEIVKGLGTQFDPVYGRLMLHLIDIDTAYEMKERSEAGESGSSELTVSRYRSAVAPGILITQRMTTVRMTVGSDDEPSGITPVPIIVLFDSMDGIVHTDDRQAEEMNYTEYGEIWFSGRTSKTAARKIETRTVETGSPDIPLKGGYKLEAVRIKDHALIRIYGKYSMTETVVALPDSSRYLYIGLSGEHCRITDIISYVSPKEYPADAIPRIAEEISYINVPAGDIPNVQVDSFRSAASEGIEVRDGLKISFRTMSLPTARLVWHCPSIELFCADDRRVNGENYRGLAFIRFDGESWECDPKCFIDLEVSKSDNFKGWDEWKAFNLAGYDTVVTFSVEGSTITVVTENAGITVKSTVTVTGIDRKIYAAVSGDQVAVTNIRIH